MTTEMIRIWHCDAGACTASAPENADGWTTAIYTHGCPAHGGPIEAHRAKVTSTTRGRGARERTTWYLTCACGWMPRPHYTVYSYSWLQKQHLAHVRELAS